MQDERQLRAASVVDINISQHIASINAHVSKMGFTGAPSHMLSRHPAVQAVAVRRLGWIWLRSLARQACHRIIMHSMHHASHVSSHMPGCVRAGLQCSLKAPTHTFTHELVV